MDFAIVVAAMATSASQDCAQKGSDSEVEENNDQDTCSFQFYFFWRMCVRPGSVSSLARVTLCVSVLGSMLVHFYVLCVLILAQVRYKKLMALSIFESGLEHYQTSNTFVKVDVR